VTGLSSQTGKGNYFSPLVKLRPAAGQCTVVFFVLGNHSCGQQEFLFRPSAIHRGTDLPSALSRFSLFARTSCDSFVPQSGFRL